MSLGSGDVDRYVEQLRRGEYLKESEVKSLCVKAREILVDESNVQRVDAPVTVGVMQPSSPSPHILIIRIHVRARIADLW